MKSLIVVFSLVLSASAFANTCLQQVTNSELLTEMALRLGTAPMNSSMADTRIGMSCDSWGALTVIVTDVTTGKSSKNNIAIGSSNACNTLKNIMDSKKNKRRGAIAAVCDSWGAMTKLIISGAKVSVETDSIGSSSQCNTIAEELNK